jgi:DNA repair protein RecO (recombination protein O)
MLHQTRGIVLNQLKYSESSIIVKVYTEEFGLQSYIVRGVRKKKGKNSAAYFQHLTPLNMVVYHKEKSNIQNVKEIKPDYPFQDLPYNVYKSSIALFINELIINVVREEEANPPLFNFLFDSIKFLDEIEDGFHVFHHMFSVQLTRYLGFYPQGLYSQTSPYFDMQEGIFTGEKPPHSQIMEKKDAQMLNYYMNSTDNSTSIQHYEINDRRIFLERLMEYYKIHIPDLNEMKSLEVLTGLF